MCPPLYACNWISHRIKSRLSWCILNHPIHSQTLFLHPSPQKCPNTPFLSIFTRVGIRVAAQSSLLAAICCVGVWPCSGFEWRQKGDQRHSDEWSVRSAFRIAFAVCSNNLRSLQTHKQQLQFIGHTKHLEACLASLGTWTARSAYLLDIYPTARSYMCIPPWMTTRNFWDTFGESIYTPSSMNGFSLWLTLLYSSFHSLGTRLVSRTFKCIHFSLSPFILTTCKNHKAKAHFEQLFHLSIISAQILLEVWEKSKSRAVNN